MADERAHHDAEEERREPAEPVASPAPPSPQNRGQYVEHLAQAGRVPGLRERREPVAAERQGERDRRDLLGWCLPPPAQPKPSAAPTAGKNDEGARAGKQAAQGGGNEAAEGRRRECDGLGFGLRAAAAAAAATAAADVSGDGVGEGGSELGLELEHRANSHGAMVGGARRRLRLAIASAFFRWPMRRHRMLSNLDKQGHENFIASN